MQTLVVIPARGGSKGIPGKNIKPLGGKPLLHYTIDAARNFTADEHICLTTDSDEIIACAQQKGLNVFFKRPAHLASDLAGSTEVLLHTIDFFRETGKHYDRILLMQPTSPFRLPHHLNDIQSLYETNLDMVVSVGVSSLNPYFALFEEDQSGFLKKSKAGDFHRRQDVPPAFYYNGSLYLINVQSLLQGPIHSFTKVRKYVMDELYCQDIDTPLDWLFCETILQHRLVNHENG
jgi:CMP-N,N'-diacetyllegionaminic acid synthase